MDWTGKSRREVERDLLAAVEESALEYRTAKSESARLTAIAADIEPFNRDGNLALQQSRRAQQAAQAAFRRYQRALHRFTQFVSTGKLPEDDEPG